MRYISAKTCAWKADVTVSCWYKWCDEDPTAPKPVWKDGEKKTGFARWNEDEVDAYLALMAKEGRTGSLKRAHEKGGKAA